MQSDVENLVNEKTYAEQLEAKNQEASG